VSVSEHLRSRVLIPKIAALVVVVVFGVTAIGVPGTLVLFGGYLLAAGVANISPELSGPPSWAAAVIVEVTLLVGCSAALAIVSPHAHGVAVSFGILALPALCGAALCVLARTPRFRTTAGTPGNGRGGLALTGTIAALAAAAWVGSHGRNFNVAWAMGGDARNHVQIMRHVISQGGLTLKELKMYPAVVNAVSALLSSAGGRAHLLAGNLMLHDARAVASTYVLAGIAIACLLMAALHEFVPSPMIIARRLPVGVIVVLLGCAAVSASPLILGTSLSEGFLSAYGSLPLVMATIVIALRCAARPSAFGLGLMAPATMIILFAWTPMVVVPFVLACLLVVQFVQHSRRVAAPAGERRSMSRGWLLAFALVAATSLLTLGVAVTQMTTLKAEFVTPGAIISPETKILLLLGLFTAALFLASSDMVQRRQLLVPLTCAVSGGLLVEWLISLAPGKTWSYYSTKTLWFFGASLIWVVFVPVIRYLARTPTRPHHKHAPTTLRTVEALVLTLVILLAVGFTTSAPNPAKLALTGWDQPTAAVITETARVANQGSPFVLWQWSDLGDDRLGNFWAALAWDTNPAGWTPNNPKLKGGMRTWAYNENGVTSQLCGLLLAYPHITVVTSSHTLGASLKRSCVGERATFMTSAPPADRATTTPPPRITRSPRITQ
jgi:hypothetical protein